MRRRESCAYYAVPNRAYLDGLPEAPLPEQREAWHYFGQYKIPLLYACLLQNWADPQDGALAPLGGQIALLDGHLFCLMKDWTDVQEATARALTEGNEAYFNEYFALAERYASACTAASADDLSEFLRMVHELEYPWFYLLPMAEAMEAWLSERVSAEELSRYFTPDRETMLGAYERAVAEFARSGGEDEKEAERIAREHAWVGYMHFWGEANAKERVLEAARSSITPSKYEPPSGALPAFVLKATRRATYFRQHFAEACALATLRLHEAFARNGIDADKALWQTPNELLAGAAPSPGVINERIKAFGLWNALITGDELARCIDALVEKVGAVSSFSGTPAAKGYAKGTAKIVLTPADAAKLEEGDILVAHETTPDVVPAMRRASAIVTDIGGLTSHAAIVSRELGKPCVIGTKIATKALKDGDQVEVDATQGIVRILS